MALAQRPLRPPLPPLRPQASSFRDAPGKAEQLWAPLAAYTPPTIELPAPLEAGMEEEEAAAAAGAAALQLAVVPQAESPELGQEDLGGGGGGAMQSVQQAREDGAEVVTSPGRPCGSPHSTRAVQAPKPKVCHAAGLWKGWGCLRD